jgi:hypothetical protein
VLDNLSENRAASVHVNVIVMHMNVPSVQMDVTGLRFNDWGPFSILGSSVIDLNLGVPLQVRPILLVQIKCR